MKVVPAIGQCNFHNGENSMLTTNVSINWLTDELPEMKAGLKDWLVQAQKRNLFIEFYSFVKPSVLWRQIDECLLSINESANIGYSFYTISSNKPCSNDKS